MRNAVCCIATGNLCYNDRVPGDEAEAFRERLLRANFFWEETGGFTFALDGDKVMLMDRRPAWYFVDGEHLAAYLEGCFDLVRIWRSRLQGSDSD